MKTQLNLSTKLHEEKKNFFFKLAKGVEGGLVNYASQNSTAHNDVCSSAANSKVTLISPDETLIDLI